MSEYYIQDAVTGEYLSAFEKGSSRWDGYIDEDDGVCHCLVFRRKADVNKMIVKLTSEFTKLKVEGKLGDEGRIEFSCIRVRVVKKYYPEYALPQSRSRK